MVFESTNGTEGSANDRIYEQKDENFMAVCRNAGGIMTAVSCWETSVRSTCTLVKETIKSKPQTKEKEAQTQITEHYIRIHPVLTFVQTIYSSTM